MVTKTKYIVIAVTMVIIVCIGLITIVVLDEDENDPPSDNTSDNVWSEGCVVFGPPYYFGSSAFEMKLNISEKGFGLLTIGPISMEDVPFSGAIGTFHNYTVITDINGTAVFNVTDPIESGEYEVIFEYNGEPYIMRIDLKVIKD